MTYFELFNIPVQLKVNPGELSQIFFKLSRQFHPDYFIQENTAMQREALEKSSMLNKAWKTFQNPDETLKYVLQLKELIEEEEKYQLPPAFLMEVLEINEQLMDAGEHPATEQLESAIQNLQAEIYAPVKEIIEQYREGITTEKELLLVKEYYYKKKYLDRIQRQLDGMQ